MGKAAGCAGIGGLTMTWEETYRAAAREKEGLERLDATLADGIDPRRSGDVVARPVER